MLGNHKLNRFIIAQESDYPKALRELKKGKKQTHWMWYIFPQIKGLGYSEISNFYAIQDSQEAKLYLKTYPLDYRLINLCQVLVGKKTNNAEKIFGPIDSMKLQASMTLFYTVSEDEVMKVWFKEVLDKFFNGELCQKTIEILEKEAQVCQ